MPNKRKEKEETSKIDNPKGLVRSMVADYGQIILSALDYAKGNNPEGRDFFKEMDNDPEFTKSWNKFKALEKKNENLQGEVDSLMGQIMLMVTDEAAAYNVESEGDYAYYVEKGRASDELMRRAGKTEIPRLIKNLRRLQLMSFGKVPSGDNPEGLRIIHSDEEYKVPSKEKDEMSRWQKVLTRAFFYIQGRPRASLSKVLGAAYEDFFDLDKICFYVWRELSGTPKGLILIDPALIKYIIPRRKPENRLQLMGYYQRHDQKEYQEILRRAGIQNPFRDEYRYMLVRNNKRIAKFTRKDLIVSSFFDDTISADIYRPQGIVAQAARIIASSINTIIMNASKFTNNWAPTGFVSLSGGAFNLPRLELFKKLLWAHLRGPKNRWRIPVIALPEKCRAELLQFTQSSKEMEFFTWFSLITTMICRLSGTDPEELSIASNRTIMAGKRMFEEGPSGVVKISRDSGLRTFLSYFANTFNASDILEELTGYEGWEIEFAGLDVKDEDKKYALIKKQLETNKTMNQVLVEEDMEKPPELTIGGVNIWDIPGIANPTIVQMIQMGMQEKTQREMMEQQQEEAGGEEEGAPGEEVPGEGGEEETPEEEVSEEEEPEGSPFGKSIEVEIEL